MEKQTSIQRIAAQLLARHNGVITEASRDHAAHVSTSISGMRSGQKRRNVAAAIASWAAGRSIPSAETIHQFRRRYPSPLWDELLAALPSETERQAQRVERRRQTMIGRYGPNWGKIVIPKRAHTVSASVPR